MNNIEIPVFWKEQSQGTGDATQGPFHYCRAWRLGLFTHSVFPTSDQAGDPALHKSAPVLF